MDKKENNFGLPKVDSTPMGVIEMEGTFYRGMAGNKKGRPLWVRICIVFFSAIVFLIPGLFSLGFEIFNYNDLYQSGGVVNLILGMFFGILLSLIGVKIIFLNVRK